MFLRVDSTSILKTLWEKGEIASVFYRFGELSAIFIKFDPRGVPVFFYCID